jgi:hypothetical protein
MRDLLNTSWVIGHLPEVEKSSGWRTYSNHLAGQGLGTPRASSAQLLKAVEHFVAKGITPPGR